MIIENLVLNDFRVRAVSLDQYVGEVLFIYSFDLVCFKLVYIEKGIVKYL